MKRNALLPWPALALALGVIGTPVSAAAQKDNGSLANSTTPCARLITPLERRLKEAAPRLKRVKDSKTREAEQSRLLFDLLSDDEAREAIAMTLGCLAAERR